MKMVAVDSNHIASIGHDPAKSELHVQFRNGGGYVYHGVTAAEHAALMQAGSKGEHLHQHIKPSKRCAKK